MFHPTGLDITYVITLLQYATLKAFSSKFLLDFAYVFFPTPWNAAQLI